MRHFFLKISKLLIGIIFFSSPLTVANTLPDFANNQDERALSNPGYILGQYWFRQLSGSSGLIEFPPAYQYLQDAMSRLVPNTDLYNKTIDIGLLNSSQSNAFVIPGNHLFIYSDIMRIITDEAAFLGLLAHEIAHLELNHYERTLESQRNEQNKTLMMLLAGIAAASAGNGEATSALWLGGIANQQENYLRHSRAQEQEADRRGRELLLASGLPVYGMAHLLGALQRQSLGSNRIEFLSTHPLPQTRVSDTLTADPEDSIVFEPSSNEFQYFRATLIAYRAAIEGNQYSNFIARHVTNRDQQHFANALAALLIHHIKDAESHINQVNEVTQFTKYLEGLISLAKNDLSGLKQTVNERLLLSPNDRTFQYLLSQANQTDQYLRTRDDALGYEKRMTYRNNIAVARKQNNHEAALYYQGLLDFSRGWELAALNLINRALRTAEPPLKQEIERSKQHLERIREAQKQQDIR
ncbi:M48 family metallopeptidase [Rhodanobacter aciditrophus]|uniref:M48 family metallopeptidase n=1 Tax=Rhodanobacter aciditrophus TaxID=1623218 RepID=UPI00366DF96F